MKLHIVIHSVTLCALAVSVALDSLELVECNLTKNVMSYVGLGFTALGSSWGLMRLLTLKKRINKGDEIAVNSAEAFIFPYPIMLVGMVTYITSVSF